MKTKLLRPIRETVSDYEQIEEEIRRVFRREIYLPLMRLLKWPTATLQNAKAKEDAKTQAIRSALGSGRIAYGRGRFSGRFSADISRELKALGAKWDTKTSTWTISASSLPYDVRATIGASESRYSEMLRRVDRQLEAVLPDELASKVKVSELLDRAIHKVEKDFQASVKGIRVAPTISPEARKKIADEWANNLQLYIKDFTTKETQELRDCVSVSTYEGNRYEGLMREIQKSYGVSARKAKFLARQETGLLMAKFKEARYQEAGIDEYHWYHVEGTAEHPVRPMHRKLGDAKERDGSKKVYRFSDPPVVDDQGHRKNPGQDYNCRCYARPVVRF